MAEKRGMMYWCNHVRGSCCTALRQPPASHCLCHQTGTRLVSIFYLRTDCAITVKVPLENDFPLVKWSPRTNNASLAWN